MLCAGALLLATMAAPDLQGRVVFSGVAVPGAVISGTQGDRTVSTTSDEDGVFQFPQLDAGLWTIRVEMRGFVAVTREVSIPVEGPPLVITLTMRPYREIVGGVDESQPAPSAIEPDASPIDAPGIVTGSSINGAATPFAQPRAYGNNRPKGPPLYSGAVSGLFGNSAWNANPYSFSGYAAPAPIYSDAQLGFTLGGPLRIPGVVKYGPQSYVAYQRGITHNAATHSALMPTIAQRMGELSPGNIIPAESISPQAQSLLRYYPLPNVPAGPDANFQSTVVTTTRQDNLQLASNSSNRRRDTLALTLQLQRTLTDSAGIFGFEDEVRQSSLNATANWSRRLSPRLSLRLRYQFTRATNGTTPFFAHRANVSGDAGITGNNQQPENWGPPTIAFPAIADLTDAAYQRTVRMSHGAGGEIGIRRGMHTFTLGGDVRRHTADVLSQPDPRGTLSFTGAATGDAFGDFLLGLPATSALASGDEATRLRGRSYDAYVGDDWRIYPTLTLNLGVRWEYEAPFTESSGHLVNLAVAPGFSAIAPVMPTPDNASLIRPDKRGIQPRLAASWRPRLGSSLVIRAGYGIYRNLGAYESLALLLAQQPPFSRTFSIQNSLATPLTLAAPFPSSLPGTSNTFAIDPDFRSAFAHTWQASAQRELPASMTATAAYIGTAGRHLMQAFLPNTYPRGAANPCPSCPSGFVFATSTGTSLRNAAQLTLRRRLHNGLTASVQYTLAKSTDDAATFANRNITARSLVIAQDWLDLAAERGPSTFDQRHLLAVQFQFTSGVGVAGGTLSDGKFAAFLKDWTLAAQLTAGSGMPLTPLSFTTVAGTGAVGVRPALTGVSTEPTASGAYANPAAYAPAAPGEWGNAGRNSIRGPTQFALDAAIARAIHVRGRVNLEWRLSASNLLNRVTFATISTIISSPQFGLPTRANPMRALLMALRVRF